MRRVVIVTLSFLVLISLSACRREQTPPELVVTIVEPEPLAPEPPSPEFEGRDISQLGMSIKLAEESAHSDTDRTFIGDLYVEPTTLRSLGFQWNIVGDKNRNGRVAVKYRKKGGQDWRQGMDLLRIKEEIIYDLKAFDGEATWHCGNLYAGSIMFLEANSAYEVVLTLIDPDNGTEPVNEQRFKVKTKRLPEALTSGRTLHVWPDPNTHTNDLDTFPTIAAAYAEANPGDKISLHAGTYDIDHMTMDKSGTRDNPIVIRAYDRDEVTITCDASPFEIAGHYHWFEGLTFKVEGVAIRARQPVTGLSVVHCRFEGRQYCGVQTTSTLSRDIYIADNTFVGTDGSWHDRGKNRPYKAVWMAGQGIDVCHNRVKNQWDGLSTWKAKPTDKFEEKLCGVDFYNNDVMQLVDDNEADYGQHNIRYFLNRFTDVYVGLSAQPIYGGPCYFVRNTQYNVKSGKVFKLNVNPAGVLIYNNTTYSGCREREPGTAFLNRGWWNTHIRNNVFLGITGDTLAAGPRDPSVSTIDYNAYTHTGIVRWYTFDEAVQRTPDAATSTGIPGRSGMKKYKTFAEFAEATGNEKHAVVCEASHFPGVIAPQPDGNSDSLHHFRPSDMFTGIDKGVVIPNITDGFSGTAPDIGYVEVDAAAPKYGPRLR